MKRSRIAFKLVSLIIVMSMLLTAGPMGTASAQSTIQGFVDVSNEAGFRSALSASNTINVQNDIIVTGGPLIVTQSPTTILGNGHTLTFSGLTADQDGLDIRADDTLVTGLTVDAGLSAPISWQGTFAIQVYDSLDIILTNVTAKNANGGILVNSSTVDISNVTTTGNSHYGINVDQGGGLTTTPLLTVNSVTNHTSPASGITPAIYVDTGIAAWVSFTEGIYKTVSDPVYGLMLYDLTEYAAELTAELAFVQANTTLTGTLDNLNATFPPTIPYFVQYEPYKINSCYTLGAALPTDTIVILVRGTKQIYSGQIGALKEFCYTELVGGTPADFDAGYAGATEHYEITVTGPGTNPLDFDTTLKIESIISKDSFATPVVLAEITLDVHIDDAVAPTIASGVAYGVASYTNITADPTLTFTVPQGYEVSTIKFTMDEAVTVVAGTQVSLAGFPYGDVAVDSTGLIVTVTPLTGNEVAAQLGTFTFSVPADAIKDLAGNALTTLSASLIVTDQTAPVMESVLPAEGEVVLGPTETFKLIVDALDLNLFKLEVDHNIVGLDEFSVYASASNVYGSPEAAAAFATAGVVVTYDATEQVWVIDFGTTVTDAFVMNGGVTFYLVLHDYADNKWGSMYDLSLVDNTYAYTIRRQDAAPVATLVTIPGTTNDVKVTFDQDVYLDGVALQSVPVSTAAEKLAFLQIFFGNPSLTAAMFNADNITIDLTSDSVTITMGDNAINPALFEALDDADTGTGDPWVGDGNGVYRIDVDVNTGAFENRDEIPCATDLEAFKIKFSVPMVNGVAQYGEPIVAIFQTAEQRALDVDPLPDMTAPTVNSMVAKGVAPYADVPAVGMTFTVPQGYEVSTIEITMSEPVTVVAVTEVTLNSVPYGLVTLSADGLTLIVTPYAGNEVAAAIGTFTFVIPANSVLDLAGNALATLEATLIVTNLVPVAVNDAYSIAEDGVLTVAARGVLANDTDFDPLTLTAVKVSDPDFGTLVLNSNGSFTYTPDAHFNGTDTFTYKANDGLTDSNIATVTITVTPVNDDPAAEDDAYKTDEDVTLNVSAVEGVLANDGDIDGDNLAAYVLTQPEHGKLTLVPDGSFTYVPNPDWNGVDTFTYQLVATPAINAAWTDEATVTITVNPIDDDPIVTKIGNQDVVVGETVTFTVVATDPEGLALIYSLVDAPIESTISATGEFSWDTTGVEPGDYTFQVCVSDGVNTICETITVTVAAAPEPQPIKIYLPIIFR